MPLHKKIVVCDLSSKYGTKQQGLVTLEPIRRGEIIYECDPVTCTFYPENDSRNKFTREQVLKLMKDHPEAYEYIRDYTLMTDDDLFEVPRYIDTKTITDECALFNHSCEPNCDFDSSSAEWTLIARRDIDKGEELTCHYGCFETEDSLPAVKVNSNSTSGAIKIGNVNLEMWRLLLSNAKFVNWTEAAYDKNVFNCYL
jgi:SET domain-containing protein